MKSKICRFVYGLALNGAMVASVYFGLFRGNEQAMNLGQFMVWAMVMLNTFVVFNEKTKAIAKTKGRGIPVLFSASADFALLGMFAAAGHFVTAAAVLWQMCAEAAIFAKEEANNDPSN
jgi:small-conductance mechanosensitive channel